MPAELPPGYPAHGDTVYLTVVDGEGNAISFINSLFAAFGSGLCTSSGVMLQNRGAGFVIDPDHPNRIAGGKRPMHTIIPGMVGQGDHAVMPFGVMGGHFQACGHAHFLTNVIDYRLDPQAALDCPRAFHFGGVLTLETTIAAEVAERLAALGHRGRVVGYTPRRRPGNQDRPRDRRALRRLRPPQGRLRARDLRMSIRLGQNARDI